MKLNHVTSSINPRFLSYSSIYLTFSFQKVLQQMNLMGTAENKYITSQLEYDFVYLSHPRAVTGVSWRKISKFMPRGMISNSLITSCRDNICRIWLETIIPDDGLLHANDEDSNYVTMAKSARHKRKLLNKLHKMRLDTCFF
jgi:hypothetical protein